MRIKPLFIGIQGQSIDGLKTNSGVVQIHDPVLLQIFLQFGKSNTGLLPRL